MNGSFNCILAGVGGQGTVLASKLLAKTAMESGFEIRTAETIGMAQRGGCVVSHVRIGGGILSPLISDGGADIVIGFEPAEAVRSLPLLKEGGAVVASQKAVRPVTAALTGSSYDGSEALAFLREKIHCLVAVDGEKICAEVGSPKVLNLALLGAALSTGLFPFSLQRLEKTVRETLAPRFIDINLKALYMGFEAAERKAD